MHVQVVNSRDHTEKKSQFDSILRAQTTKSITICEQSLLIFRAVPGGVQGEVQISHCRASPSDFERKRSI
jgi:hypothetical protein